MVGPAAAQSTGTCAWELKIFATAKTGLLLIVSHVKLALLFSSKFQVTLQSKYDSSLIRDLTSKPTG